MYQLQNKFKDSIQALLQTDAINADEVDQISKKMWFNSWHPEYGFCDTYHSNSFKSDLGK